MLARARLLAWSVLCGMLAASVACGGSSDPSQFGDGTSSGSSGSSGSTTGPFGGTSGGTSGTSGTTAKAEECKKMDIVFVIDNSGSMREEQKNLATNFPKFAKVIGDYKTKSGDALDYRISVTSSDDTKDKGKFFATRGADAPSGCNAGPSRPWLERADGDVPSFFSCRAELGTGGSGTERPLESALLGVTARIADGTNVAGGQQFVRDDALLAFVVITDEDEGSAGDPGKLARPMAEYPKKFDAVKSGQRGRWAAAVIAGPGPGKCTSAGLGDAQEAKRMKGFIGDVGKNGVFSSICTGDLTTGLTAALATFDQACKDFPTGPVK